MATRTWDGGGANDLASTAANWSDDTAPTTGDTVIFDGTSDDNCTWDITAVLAEFNAGSADYDGTITLGSALNVGGNVTLPDAGAGWNAATYTVTVSATSTITTNAKEFYGLSLTPSSGAVTYTLADNATVNNTLTINNSGTAADITINGNTLIAKGDIATGATNRNVKGTTNLQVNGGGNQNVTMTFYAIAGGVNKLSLPFEIKSTGGTVTIAGSTFRIGGNWTHTSGTVSCTGTIYFYDTLSITSNTMTFNNVYFWNTAASKTITLNDKMTIDGNLAIDSGTDGAADHTVNGNIDLKGNFSTHATNRSLLGTGTITMIGTSGTSTVSFTGYLSAGLGKNFTINSSNTIQFGSKIDVISGTWTYTAATAVDTSTNTSTIDINGNVTLNTDGIDFYNISHNYTNTTTLSSALTSTNLHLFSAATTFSGAQAITANNMTFGSVSGFTATLSNDITVSGLLDLCNTNDGSDITLSGAYKIYATGNVQKGASAAGADILSSNTTLEFSGSASKTWEAKGVGRWGLPIIVNKDGGTLTVLSTALIWLANSNFTVTLGTVDFTTNSTTIKIGNENSGTPVITMTTQNDFFNIISAGSWTLGTDITVNGYLDSTRADGGDVTLGGAYKIYLEGDLKNTSTQANCDITGAATIELSGGGSPTFYAATNGGKYNVSIIVNKSGGTVATNGTISYASANTPTFTQTSVASTINWGTSLFKTFGSCNLNMGASVLYDLQVSTAGTATLTGNVNVGHTLTVDASRTLVIGSNTLTLQGDLVNNGSITTTGSTVVMAGTSTISGNNISFNNLTLNAGSTTHLTVAKTYAVTGTFTGSGTLASPAVIDSTSAGTLAVLNVSGTSAVVYTNPTDINSDGGNPIFDYKGTITTSNNWYTDSNVLIEPWVWGSGTVTQDTLAPLGGTGSCVLMNPSSQVTNLYWKFLVPCTNATALTIHFYVKKTSAASNPTLTFSASGCGVSAISNASVTLTDTYAEYNATTLTPSSTGFVECIMKALDGSTTGDVYIDAITVS